MTCARLLSFLLIGFFLFATTGCIPVPASAFTPTPSHIATNLPKSTIPAITQTYTAIPTKIRPTLTSTPTLYPVGKGELIAFNSEILNEIQYDVQEGFISTVNVNSGAISRLTPKEVIARRATWSPDGRYIAFNIPEDSGTEMLYLMNANGTNQTFIEKYCFAPVWSPDGLFIACSSEADSGYGIYSGFYIIDLITKEKWRVSSDRRSSISWSPDSKKIAFNSRKKGSEISNIFSRNTIGDGNPIELTSAQSYDGNPKWSPDGKYILFTSLRTGVMQIYIMNADGSHEYALTVGDQPNFDASWSPDGTKIVFVSLRHEKDLSKCPGFTNPCNSEIYIMNADGSEQARLTNKPGEDSEPVWSPDGQYLAFMSFRDEPDFRKCKINCNSEIYVMTVDGKKVMRLTNNQVYDCRPTWQPKQ